MDLQCNYPGLTNHNPSLLCDVRTEADLWSDLAGRLSTESQSTGVYGSESFPPLEILNRVRLTADAQDLALRIQDPRRVPQRILMRLCKVYRLPSALFMLAQWTQWELTPDMTRLASVIVPHNDGLVLEDGLGLQRDPEAAERAVAVLVCERDGRLELLVALDEGAVRLDLVLDELVDS